MTPAAARAAYRRAMRAAGETLTITRGATVVTCRGRLIKVGGGYADQVVDTIAQGKPVAIVLKEDLDAAGFTPVKTDQLNTQGGPKVAITFVDSLTRRVQGELVAYELHLAG